MTIPTTKETTAQNLALLQSQVNQKSPLNDKAFLRVLAAMLAVIFTSLYKFGIDSIKQVFGVTAGVEGLTILGAEYEVPRKAAQSTVLTVTLPGTNGTVIPATRTFVGALNGIRYSIDASAVVAGGVATLSITAQTAGIIGNLNNGDSLSIDTPVAGASTVATVTATTTTGTDQENIEDWRIRILDVERAPGGGGNAADYRNWSQEVAGVARAYPYSGKPAAAPSSTTADRTVYVEATTDIDPDGIPTPAILTAVRDSITTDPVTALSRQPLGLTDDTLYVEAITRTPFYVRISGLSIAPSIEAVVKIEIETQLATYFLSLRPFIDGIDAVVDRNDVITSPTVSNVVQDILDANGGSAQSVVVGIVLGAFVSEYNLSMGETAKLSSASGITYV